MLLAEQCVAVQSVAVYAEHGGWVDALAVDHDREVAVELAVAVSDDGDGLSGAYVLSHLNQVLGVVGVYCLQSVAVAYHYHVTHVLVFACEAHRSVEHRLHVVAVLGVYLHYVVLAHRGFAHGQRKRVFVGFEQTEVDAERIGAVEESGC